MRIKENMTVAELVEMLGISKQAVHKRIRASGIKPSTCGTGRNAMLILTRSQAKIVRDWGKK